MTTTTNLLIFKEGEQPLLLDGPKGEYMADRELRYDEPKGTILQHRYSAIAAKIIDIKLGGYLALTEHGNTIFIPYIQTKEWAVIQ